MNSAANCGLCDGSCADADLTLLLHSDLAWLWARVADVADRRGDPELTGGSLTVSVPAPVEQRHAAAGLLGGHALRAGQSRRVELTSLTTKIRVRGATLTPGAVAAHASGRRLATKAQARTTREDLTEQLRRRLDGQLASLPSHVQQWVAPDLAWPRLHQSGWIARVLKDPEPIGVLDRALDVLAALPEPGTRIDRRTLVPGNPHALDDGTLPGLVLALAGVNGRRPRHAWDALGVDIDNLSGGLLALGLHPAGWHLPRTAVVTLPPRELANITWAPPPSPGTWAFVTENPSVLAAAADLTLLSGDRVIHLLCTVGTPSAVETTAIGSLCGAGWRVAVRADFDAKGLAHVRAMLTAAAGATPWRMGADDYRASWPTAPEGLIFGASDSPWDVELAAAMTETGSRAFEEALMGHLMSDLVAGQPSHEAEL